MILDLVSLFILAIVARAAPAPTNSLNPTAPGNCTFHALIAEICLPQTPHKNETLTFAIIPFIKLPSGDEAWTPTGNNTGVHIEPPNVWYIKIEREQDSINEVLSVAQKNGVVNFGWNYSGKGGTPMYSWTEEKDGFEGRYGCRRTVDWTKERLDCSPDIDIDQRASEHAFWGRYTLTTNSMRDWTASSNVREGVKNESRSQGDLSKQISTDIPGLISWIRSLIVVFQCK